ncbi:hypothetical protein C0J52_02239 [Blattella germanica]|nr:hypothetical protein C0J52_02239 [Blattella germanica]
MGRSIALLFVLVLGVLREASCTDESPPRLRLDPELRRALLRALTQLELEAQRKAGIQNPTLQTPFDDQPIDEEQEANIKRDLETLLGNYENFQATQEPEQVTTIPGPENVDQAFNYHASGEELTTPNKEENHQEVGTFESQRQSDETTLSKDENQNFDIFNFHTTAKDSNTMNQNKEFDNNGFNSQTQGEDSTRSFNDNGNEFTEFNTHVPSEELTVKNNDDQNFDIIKIHTPTIIGNENQGFDEIRTTASPQKAQTEENNDEPNFDVINFHAPQKDVTTVSKEEDVNFDIIHFHGPSKDSTADVNKNDNIRDNFDSNARSLSKELTVNGNDKLNSIQTSAKDNTDIKLLASISSINVTEEKSEKLNDLQRQETGSLVENQEGSAIFFKNDLKTDNDIQSNLISPAGEEDKKKDKKKQVEHEVSIFEAPLVAAFTLEQDERGNPKSVVPLLRPLNKPTSISTTPSTQIHQNNPSFTNQNAIQEQNSNGSFQKNNLNPGIQSNTFGSSPAFQNQQNNFQPSNPLINQHSSFTPNSFLPNQQNVFNQEQSLPNQQNNFQKLLPQQNTFQSSSNQQNGFQTSTSIGNVQNNGNSGQSTFPQNSNTNSLNNFQPIPSLTNQQNNFEGSPLQNQQNNFLQAPSITNQQISFQQSSSNTNQQNIFQQQPVTNQQNGFQQSHSITNQPTAFQRLPVFQNQQSTFQIRPSHANTQTTVQQVPSVTNQQTNFQNDPFPVDEHGLVPPPLNQDHIFQPAATQLNPQQISHTVTVQQSVEPFQEPPVSHRTQRQESGTGIVDFQRSIGIQFGHQTVHQPLQSIQNLLYQSGIAGDLQSNIRNGASPNEDLSLVSRILALNHEGRNESVRSQTSHSQSTNQEDLRVVNKVLSLNHIDKVQPPSRFITPPFV